MFADLCSRLRPLIPSFYFLSYVQKTYQTEKIQNQTSHLSSKTHSNQSLTHVVGWWWFFSSCSRLNILESFLHFLLSLTPTANPSVHQQSLMRLYLQHILRIQSLLRHLLCSCSGLNRWCFGYSATVAAWPACFCIWPLLAPHLYLTYFQSTPDEMEITRWPLSSLNFVATPSFP